ncbi:MAG: hypothetical protein J7L66_00295, partial [Anaerolineaceae bacterium]|nr:hypothetical protein [Anaerolineaceae bacterium]
MTKRNVNFFIILSILFVGVNIWVIQAFKIEGFPIRRAVTFDDYIRMDYRDRIDNEKPKIVAIGDSAIRQLDDAVFTKESGMKSTFFSTPGSGSAYWYLFIRNEMISARHKPDYLLVFFRGTMLTEPEYRVTGDYFIRLEEIATPSDGDVFEMAINSRKHAWVRICEQYIPLFAYRSEIYFNIVQWFRDLVSEKILGNDKTILNRAYDSVFDDEQINDLLWEEYLLNVDAALYRKEALDFSSRESKSFLPYIIRDLKLMGIKPVFIRVKYRSHAMGESDQPGLLTYLSNLKVYIEEKGGIYIDLVKVDALTADMYRDNFHFDA